MTHRLPRFLDFLALTTLITLIVVTPLAFGSVHVWAYTLMEFGALLLVGFAFAGNSLEKKGVVWVQTPLNVLALLFIGYILLQMIPLPEFLLQWVSPRANEFFGRYFMLGGAEKDALRFTVSLNPHKTKIELLKILACLGAFFYIINRVHTRKKIHFIIWAIILTGVFEAFYAIFARVTGQHAIWWWKKSTEGYYRGSGTFINPNHLAGYLEMTILLTMGYIFGLGKRRKKVPKVKGKTWRDRLGDLVRQRETFGKQTLVMYFVIIMLLGLWITASRGGYLAFGIGFVFFLALLFRRERISVILAMVLAMGIFTFSVSQFLDEDERYNSFLDKRYQSIISGSLFDDRRMAAFSSTLAMVDEFRLTGTGLGTFSDVFPKYQPEHLNTFFLNVHNDWLEVLIELGALGAGIVLLALVFYLIDLGRHWWSRRDPFAFGIGLGALGAILAIFTHNMVEFNFHIPANLFLFSCILGLGFVAAHSRSQKGHEVFNARISRIPFGQWGSWLVLVVFVISSYFYGQSIFSRLMAESHCPTQINSTLTLERNPTIEAIKKALEYEPQNSECIEKLIARYRENKKFQPVGFFSAYYGQKSVAVIKKAIRLNPARGDRYLWLGDEYYFLSWTEPNNAEDHLDKAIKAFENAVFFNPKNDSKVFATASLWFKNASLKPHRKQLYFRKAFELLRNTLTLKPERWREALMVARDYGSRQSILDQVIPGSESSEKFGRIKAEASQWIQKL